jgi:hypothetical protein
MGLSSKKFYRTDMRSLLALLFVFSFQIGLSQQHRAIPDYATLQYAGSIGFFSAGVGYNVFRKHRVSIHYGMFPGTVVGD